MTAQEIFNKVALHLVTQNVKAIDIYGACKYLDRRAGRKCAIGCLIPDGHPAQAYDGDVSSMLCHNVSRSRYGSFHDTNRTPTLLE